MARSSIPSLFLVDGYALIYRAFFAMIGRPLRTARGENTSAVWGVANFLHRLFEQHRPDCVAWVHDAGSSFREEVYPEYKATRQKLDDELQDDFDRSVERIAHLLDAFRVPLVAVEGYEADDVIGTLADKAVGAGMQVVIVSGDKDFYQLIGPRVALLNPGRRGPAAVEEQWVDQANAADRLGVGPERVVDFLALVGDSSDNVPGVRGVGEKTARTLLEQYGDLESILEHAAEISGKRAREALLAEADNARLSRDLVTIRHDVPVDIDVKELVVGEWDRDRLQQLYTDLEFHSLLPKLEIETTPATIAERPFRVVDRADVLAEAVTQLGKARVIAIDTATTSLSSLEADLVGLGLAHPDGRAWYFPFAHRRPDGELTADDGPRNLPRLDSETLRPLRALLEDPTVPKAAHNVKDDWLALRRAGVELRGVAYDSMLGSFVLDPGRRSHALDVLMLEHLNERLMSRADVVGRGRQERPFAEVSIDTAAAYCCTHSVSVLRLRDAFAPELEHSDLGDLLDQLEMPLVAVLVDMEWRGIAIDVERLDALSEQFATELRELEAGIHVEAGTDFNINSTPQLRHILFEKLGLPVLKRTKTGPSTDADVLGELATMGFELPKLLLEYREVSKLCSTYVDTLPLRVNPVTGRIHTSFSQTGAATGRLSSADPNLQNIPVRTRRGEEIRRCFVPAEGCVFVVADYSQIELRLLAHLSEDPAFLEAFRHGGDIHRETAAIIFDVAVPDVTPDMRARAKTINFATIYGQGAYALSRQLGITQEEAREFIELYFERFAGVRQFLDGCVARAKERGFVETILGRRRYVPELHDRTYNIRAFGERVAMNSPLQGSAADLIKRAMIRADASLKTAGLEAAMLLQVHDELIVEAPEAEAADAATLLRREMEGAVELSVPLVVDLGIGGNWLDAKR